MRAFIFATGAVCFGAWSYACAAGDETSSTSTSSTNAATTNASASTSMSASSSGVGAGGTGGDGQGGSGGSAMGGAGGSGPCVSCNDAFGECVVNLVCPPSSALCPGGAISSWQTLLTCVCGYCGGDCSATCNNMGMDAPGCAQCVGDFATTACNTQFQACVVN